MFNVSKKSVLLSIIFFTALHTQCLEDSGKITVNATFEMDRKEESTFWKVASIVGPTIATAAVTYALKTWYEDPEATKIDKDLKKIELQTKSHPDYPIVSMLLEKNKAREKKLELDMAEATIIKHHQDELATFLRCDKTLYTQDYCNFMATIHQRNLEKFVQ
jgi:hypothetical protein